jgi:hypothetical protein
LELQQALSRATSQAERDSLEKQYRAKKEAEDRKAFEQNKKIQLQQAKINLATQLSNLAVIAFAPGPANLLTLGLAGQIAYGVQAALALATYALNTSRIRSAQYAYGGAVPSRGGKFGGQPHSRGGTPFTYRGTAFEAEVNELAIIRTKNAPASNPYTITGNQSQIASALNTIGGGINFQPGAQIKKLDYGGSLGSFLEAPAFRPGSSNVFVTNSSDNTLLIAEIRALREENIRLAQEQSKRIDRLEVVQVTSTVTNAQKRQAKQSDIATL